jgi:hypothetical protein
VGFVAQCVAGLFPSTPPDRTPCVM